MKRLDPLMYPNLTADATACQSGQHTVPLFCGQTSEGVRLYFFNYIRGVWLTLDVPLDTLPYVLGDSSQQLELVPFQGTTSG